MYFTQTDGLFGGITSFVLVHYIVCYHVKHTILTHFTSIDTKKKVCQNSHLLFYAQSPDFHKLGLCYNLKILYL